MTPRAVPAIQALSDALAVLRTCGVIRSTRFVGDIGEWYVATLYGGHLAKSRVQTGWDVLEPSTGARLQVKTQTFDRRNQWNYLSTSPDAFDRLVVVLLTEALTLRDLYSIPSPGIAAVVRVGKESKPMYRFRDLEPWRVRVSDLPGYAELQSLVE